MIIYKTLLKINIKNEWIKIIKSGSGCQENKLYSRFVVS